MKISQETIDKVRDLGIVDVVGRYVHDLKKAGSSYKAISPFTNEKTPSFCVTPSKQIFKCFSSGAGGDGIAFMMELQKIGFTDAIKTLATDFSIPIGYDDTPVDQETIDKLELMDRVNRATMLQYHKHLADVDPSAMANTFLFGGGCSTLTGRGYNFDTYINWQLGYAPDQWKFITSKANKSNTFATARELGLISEKNGKTFDFFRNRIIFPIQDHRGSIVGFAGRRLDGNNDYPKYINSQDSAIFNKGKILYGLCYASQSIRKAGHAYLTEGYTDVISFHQHDFTNTVASCGTSLTADQAKLLKRYCQKVTIIYDSDASGEKATLRAIDILLTEGFQVMVCTLPEGHDPDSFVRQYPDPRGYMKEHTEDAIHYKALKLLEGIEDPLTRNDHFQEVANTISKVEQIVSREDYSKWVARNFDLRTNVMNKLIEDACKRRNKINGNKNGVKKNTVIQLDQPNIYPFFEETLDEQGNFKEIKINRYRFVQLLGSFGYTRHEINNDSTTFVRINDNVIKQTNKDEIIDHFERFLKNEYNYQQAGCHHVNYESLTNKFYGGLGSYFSKDLFNRVRLDTEIIFNKDTKDTSYLYYQNGFVKINSKGWELIDYSKMEGSVWEDQLLNRNFQYRNVIDKDLASLEAGVFADFVFRIANQDLKRFSSLCSIIGYLMHDYYDYKLKSVNLTDSTLSDDADGRSGKTLLSKMIGHIRSYCEINGKNFNATDKNKYEDVKPGTQVLHINDVRSRGNNRFDFEDVLNDVTEGYMVNAKYMQPYRHHSKIIISSNSPINIVGGSHRDRVIEYELSDYFHVEHSPEDEYKQWFGRDWDKEEYIKFDNFMCYCSHLFHKCGIMDSGTINLEERKLRRHTSPEFLEFLKEVEANLEKEGEPFPGYSESIANKEHCLFTQFSFDKRKFYEKFKEYYPDYDKPWFSQKKFTTWLKLYAQLKFKIKKPFERRSDGKSIFQFIEDDSK